MGAVTLSPVEAERLVVDILLGHGAGEANAALTARALVAAEIDGQQGHGLSRAASYAAQLQSGKVDGFAAPEIVERHGAMVRIDAANGFAYPALDMAVRELETLAARNRIAAAAVFRSHHLGQAGYHVERLADRGLVALLFGNTPQAIAPWGGRKGVFGTNPVAFAAPRVSGPPLVIDLALSKAARGKVALAHRRGESIPEGWALDADGRPTSDPAAALEGTMLPLGDAKGSALVLMVEVLAAALTGAHFGFECGGSFLTPEGGPPGVGQLLLAFDPGRLSGGGFSRRLEVLLSAVDAQEGARLPGANRAERRRRAGEEGIRIDQALFRELDALRCPA